MSIEQSVTTATERIVKREGVCGGDACVRGTRIPVWSIESWKRGVGQQDLEGYFTTPLTARDIQAALDYYRENTEEVEHQIVLDESA